MKKHIFSAFLLLAVLFTGSVYAAEGDSNFTNVVTEGDVTVGDDLSVGDDMSVTDAIAAASVTTTGDITYRTNLIANGRYGANSTVLFSSSTTFQQAGMPYALVLKAIGNNPTVEVSKLPAGTNGQEVVFRVYACGPAGSWRIDPDSAAATPVKATGWNSITFAGVGQSATFLYLNSTLGWIIKGTGSSGSVALPTVAAASVY